MILVHEIITLYIYVLFITAIFSWVPASSGSGGVNSIRRVLSAMTEPVLRPLRQILPQPRAGGIAIDFSVMVAIILLYVINRII
jgi:YggT family protein